MLWRFHYYFEVEKQTSQYAYNRPFKALIIRAVTISSRPDHFQIKAGHASYH